MLTKPYFHVFFSNRSLMSRVKREEKRERERESPGLVPVNQTTAAHNKVSDLIWAVCCAVKKKWDEGVAREHFFKKKKNVSVFFPPSFIEIILFIFPVYIKFVTKIGNRNERKDEILQAFCVCVCFFLVEHTLRVATLIQPSFQKKTHTQQLAWDTPFLLFCAFIWDWQCGSGPV